ncbi:MAG: DUF1549 domain-containing protein [Luteolibacter sp.]
MIRKSIITIFMATPTLAVFADRAAANPEDRPDPAMMREAALQIDRHVATFYRDRQFAVPEAAEDAKFLRRTYLTVVGRVPTHEETTSFLASDAPEKRQALVASLLESPGYVSHMASWVFDLIRIRDHNGPTNLGPYRHWVRAAMDENMPWDEFTRRLLASTGSGWDQQNAAVGYYVRDRGMPHDNLANSMRIFLGKRMECAQCHDDPFGDTERRDFYELAAFTDGQYEMNRDLIEPLFREFREDGTDQSEEYRIARMLGDNIFGLSLAGGGRGRIALPPDYQYRNGRPGEMLGAKTPFGRTVRMSPHRSHDDGREKLADWVTTRNDLQYPAVIANRMWRRVMGQGLVEPVDDFSSIETSHHPALFKQLAELMVELKYDLKAFQHVLLLTRTYQFETNPNPSTIHGADDFHGRRLQRLSAEQVWDSLVTLATGNPDASPPPALDDTIYLNGRPLLAGSKSMTQLAAEIHGLRNERQFRTYFADLVKQIQNSGSASASVGSTMRMPPAGASARGGLIRAANLPSPAPRGHFLNVFGQSDREVVDASSREPNIGQVLSLMNGFVQKEIISNPDSVLFLGLKESDGPRDRIHRLCLTILSRPPTDVEMEWMLAEVRDHGESGIRNLAAALVMSSEFLFLQ